MGGVEPALPDQAGRARPDAAPGAVGPPPAALRPLLARASVDLAPLHRPPRWLLLAMAAAVALAGSLVADAVAVHVTTSAFPATARFSHFRLADYGALTVVGVLGASVAWPVVARVSSAPRRVYFRLAVVATAVLWLPDGLLLFLGEPGPGVAALMVMHLLIALITYNALVRLAPVRPWPAAEATSSRPVALDERTVRRVWNAMAVGVGLELVLGVATIVSVPFRRPDSLLPARGTSLYAAHAAVGIALGVGAVVALVLSLLAGRMARIGAVVGGLGVLVGLAGGVLASFQAARLLGMGVMMIGVVVAAIGYLIPAMEAMGKAEAAKAQAAREAMVAKGAQPPGVAEAAAGGTSGSDRHPD